MIVPGGPNDPHLLRARRRRRRCRHRARRRPCRRHRTRRALGGARALRGGPLHRVRRHLHRPRPARRQRLHAAELRRAGDLLRQHRRRLRRPLELQRRLQGRPERQALLRHPLRPALRRRRQYGQGTFPGGIPYAGSGADLNTYQITGVLAYDVNPNVKVYGGLRAQRLDAEATLAFVGPTFGLPGYTVDADSDWGYGYLVGAAYARPEIALRVALTYFSKIEHNLDTTEFGGIPIPCARLPRRRHPHQRRHAPVGHPRGPVRRRARHPRLRLGALGRLVRVHHRAADLHHRPAGPAARRLPTTGGPTPSASPAASPTSSPARSRSATSPTSAAR
jgi:hypothetical protein